MQREILFRGKRPDTGGWVYGYYCKHIERQVCPMGDELKPEDIAHLIINDCFADWNMPTSLQCYDVDPETVGQYTGLKDKNGKEIYEGDIVRYTFDNPDSVLATENGLKVRTDKIFWQEWRASFAIGCELTNNDLFRYVRNGNRVEVIGNIHDNPELLEEGAAK